MYLFKNEKEITINQTIASEVIGCDRSFLNQVLKGQKHCSKMVAYCITKYLDENAEIEDYFVREEN